MVSSNINRGEKLSTLKLTLVQYGILIMMLGLVAGLWRLQVLDVESYRVLAQQNRIRDQLFTQSLGRRLIKRCPLKEAEALARQAQPSSLGRWEQTRGRLQR